jgi:hypothetical protein
MPAQPGDDPGALGDEVFAVINQQPPFAFDTVEVGHRQSSIAQRRSPSASPAHFTSRKWSCVVVPTVFVASKRPLSSILTAVWLRLWASIAMIIMEWCPSVA